VININRVDNERHFDGVSREHDHNRG